MYDNNDNKQWRFSQKSYDPRIPLTFSTVGNISWNMFWGYPIDEQYGFENFKIWPRCHLEAENDIRLQMSDLKSHVFFAVAKKKSTRKHLLLYVSNATYGFFNGLFPFNSILIVTCIHVCSKNI